MALIEGQDWGWRLDRRVSDVTLRQVFQSLQRYLSGKDEEVTYDIRDLNNAVAAAKQAAQDADAAATNALDAAQDALAAANDASGDAGVALSAAQAAQTAASNAEQTALDAANAAADALLAAAAAEDSAQQAEATATTAMTAAQDALDAAGDAEQSAQDALDAAGSALQAAGAASSAAAAAQSAANDAQDAAAAAQAAADAAQGRADDAWDYADDVDERLDEFQDGFFNEVVPQFQQMSQDILDLSNELGDILPITETKIADDAISTPKLQANSITAGKIGAGEVVAGKLAADSVVANNIVANAVTADKIAANAVTAGKINAGAVTAGKIAADAVTANNLAAMNLGVGKYIRSTTYTPGVDGWSVDADGDAEFNDVTVRGHIESSTIEGTEITGGRFQTATSGPRVVIDSTEESRGIRWPSSEAGEVDPGSLIVQHDHTELRTGLTLSSPSFGVSDVSSKTRASVWANYYDPQGTGGEGFYHAGVGADDVALVGERQVEVEAGSHADAGRVSLSAYGLLDGGGEVRVNALGGEVHLNAQGGGTINLDADNVLVNGQPIGSGGGSAPSIFSSYTGGTVSVASRAWKAFGPHDGTIKFMDSDYSQGTLVLPGYNVRMTPGWYQVSGLFMQRTLANAKTTLVVQWSNADTAGADDEDLITIPMEGSSTGQNARIPFGPHIFQVTNASHNWRILARHVSPDNQDRNMMLNSLTITRLA